MTTVTTLPNKDVVFIPFFPSIGFVGRLPEPNHHQIRFANAVKNFDITFRDLLNANGKVPLEAIDFDGEEIQPLGICLREIRDSLDGCMKLTDGLKSLDFTFASMACSRLNNDRIYRLSHHQDPTMTVTIAMFSIGQIDIRYHGTPELNPVPFHDGQIEANYNWAPEPYRRPTKLGDQNV